MTNMKINMKNSNFLKTIFGLVLVVGFALSIGLSAVAGKDKDKGGGKGNGGGCLPCTKKSNQ